MILLNALHILYCTIFTRYVYISGWPCRDKKVWLFTKLVPKGLPLVETLNSLSRSDLVDRINEEVEPEIPYLGRAMEVIGKFRNHSPWSSLLTWRTKNWPQFEKREFDYRKVPFHRDHRWHMRSRLSARGTGSAVQVGWFFFFLLVRDLLLCGAAYTRHDICFLQGACHVSVSTVRTEDIARNRIALLRPPQYVHTEGRRECAKSRSASPKPPQYVHMEGIKHIAKNRSASPRPPQYVHTEGRRECAKSRSASPKPPQYVHMGGKKHVAKNWSASQKQRQYVRMGGRRNSAKNQSASREPRQYVHMEGGRHVARNLSALARPPHYVHTEGRRVCAKSSSASLEPRQYVHMGGARHIAKSRIALVKPPDYVHMAGTRHSVKSQNASLQLPQYVHMGGKGPGVRIVPHWKRDYRGGLSALVVAWWGEKVATNIPCARAAGSQRPLRNRYSTFSSISFQVYSTASPATWVESSALKSGLVALEPTQTCTLP